MILLSYSTIAKVIECNQYWLNKQMGLPAKEFDYFTTGKQGHETIQKHVSGVAECHTLTEAGIVLPEFYFPVVETKDFDEATHFEYKVNDKYLIHGYMDGFNLENGRMLEIKISTSPWPVSKYKSSYQRKCYSLARPEFKSGVLITAKPDLSDLKKYEVPFTQKDRDEALQWIYKGIEIIDKSIYDGGECVNCYRCVYGDVCGKSKYAR